MNLIVSVKHWTYSFSVISAIVHVVDLQVKWPDRVRMFTSKTALVENVIHHYYNDWHALLETRDKVSSSILYLYGIPSRVKFGKSGGGEGDSLCLRRFPPGTPVSSYLTVFAKYSVMPWVGACAPKIILILLNYPHPALLLEHLL